MSIYDDSSSSNVRLGNGFVFPLSSTIVIANVGFVFDVVSSISTEALKPTLVSDICGVFSNIVPDT